MERHKHVLPGQHVYKGRLFFGFSPPDVLDAVKDFDVRDDDVFIVTFPKAGTTWLQEIVWLIVNDGDTQKAKGEQVYFRSPFLEFKDLVLNEVGLELAKPMPSPRVIKTHLPVDLAPTGIFKTKCKKLVLFRNPKDLCVSYFHFYRSSSSFGNFQGSWPEFLEMFLDGHVDHGSWFDFTKGWWEKRDNSDVRILFYEDMKKDLKNEIKKISSFLDKNDIPDEIVDKIANHCCFESMRTNPMTNHHDVYSINKEISPLLRKGMVGDWKSHFTVEQSEYFDTVYVEKMERIDIPFQYQL
ncbi:sulfotransferase 1 family member D1-like [Saccostrea cucullata]|uniref:sulfotransferase 1 family member D1-like n=1 Tax=Saccostrea cuccullata TaxID=36930 RepID=UPI002ED12C2D